MKFRKIAPTLVVKDSFSERHVRLFGVSFQTGSPTLYSSPHRGP